MEGDPDPVCFYEVLGLGRGCTADQIKRAYRRLAVLHHPDKNIGNEESNAHKFKLIAEAYEVLSDDEKRRAYDSWGRAGVAAHESGAQPHTASAGAATAPPSASRAHRFEEDFGLQHAREIFQAFFGGQDPFMHHHQHHQQRGAGPGMMGFGAFPGFGFGEDEEEDDFFSGPGFGLTSSLFGGGGGGGGGGIFGRFSPLDSPAAFFSPPSGFGARATSAGGASSTTHTVTSGGGGSTRSMRRIVRIGLDGTRRTRTETTIVHADGRREVQVEEEEEEEEEEQRLEASPSTPALEQRAHRHGHGHGHGHHHGHH